MVSPARHDFVTLKPFEERQDPALSAQALVGATFANFAMAEGGTVDELFAAGNAFSIAANEHPLLEAVRGTMKCLWRPDGPARHFTLSPKG